MRLRAKHIALVMGLICTVLHSQTILKQKNGIFRICRGSITDSDAGMNKIDYDHNENTTLTLSIPGAKSITLKFSNFCTEKDNDVLRIFDGKDTSASLIGKWSGNSGPGTVVSKDSAITLHFKSDKSIACSGWKAQVIITMIAPSRVKFSQPSPLIATPNCKDSIFRFVLDQPMPCDSISIGNTSLSGPSNPSIKKITAINCSKGMTQLIEIKTQSGLNLNGQYTLTHKHGYRDFCDSIYPLTTVYKFSITNCPIVVSLKSDKDTICRGDCVKITLSATGGDSSKYTYNWTPSSLSGKGPFNKCLTSNQRYIVKVQDGTSTPASDTIDIVVLAPPSAQQDTEVCYYNNIFKLRATPAGGTWKGPGIVNGATGEFKPSLVYGATKVWYQIGSCTDTVIVTVWAPWNLENMFCPSKSAIPLYWYGPAGGTWSGPKTTTTGIFKPDTAGKYSLTYTWKGCTSLKTVYVQAIVVPKFDTICESVVNAKLKFAPLGLYPQYFSGLTNYYYGTYEPSRMGGPKNYNILYVTQNGCRDTTRLTLLPGDAGLNDTFCPSAGKQPLKTFRPNNNYSWKSKGINGVGDIYDPSWWKAGKSNIDTLVINTPTCQDKKLVYIINNQILKPDTLFFCKEDTTTLIINKGVITSIAGGIWTGLGVVKKQSFNPQITGPGLFKIIYSSKGCDDTLLVVVRNKPLIQLDTSICLIDKPITLYKKDTKGIFWGTGITNSTGIFSPSKAGMGKQVINYRSSSGCLNTVNIVVDTVLSIKFNSPTFFCSKDSLFTLQAQPAGGTFYGTGVIGANINPKLARLGNLKVYYNLSLNACATKDSMSFVVNSPLSVSVTPRNDSVCYGTILTLNALISGGIVANQKINWSHGQNGLKTFYIGNQNGNLIITGSDGCSDNAADTAKIYVYPRIWSIASVSDTVCRGLNGWARVKLGNGNPYKTKWSHDPSYKKDTLIAPADNRYRVTITDNETGCFGDTTVEIPGYQAIQAGFTIQKSFNTECLTPLDQTATFINQSAGGTRGIWKWGDGKSSLFDPFANPTHTFDGLETTYRVMLAIENYGGCKDTAWEEICYHDTIFAFIPNAFSPNGDGINDELDCQLYGATETTVYIMNRWGEIVFESTEISQRWNGDSAGKPCPEGVYAVVVEFKGNHQAKRVLSSSVTLLRPKS